MDPSSPPTTPSSPRPEETQLITNGEDHPHLSLGILNIAAPSPKKRTKTPLKPPYSIKSPSSESLQEIILLSSSPHRKSKARLIERMETVEEPIDLIGPRKRCKNKASPMANQQNCASPRVRRSRRRLDQENRDDKEVGVLVVDEIVKPRKRKPSTRPRKEKASAVVPSSNSLSSSSPRTVIDDQSNLDNIKQLINDLVMWRDVAKSSLWFGFGYLCFLSSSFFAHKITTRFHIFDSVFSGISHLGLLFLAFSFLCNSCSPRYNLHLKLILSGYAIFVIVFLKLELKEDDIVRIARKVLPVAKFVIVKTRTFLGRAIDDSQSKYGYNFSISLFAPILLFGAEYRFLSASLHPKLYASYSMQIEGKAWKACSHKKIVAVSAALAFWNLSSIKTGFSGIISWHGNTPHCRQHSESKIKRRRRKWTARRNDASRQRKRKRKKNRVKALMVIERKVHRYKQQFSSCTDCFKSCTEH
ncbi:hypothetical protein MKW92_029711 [Papaver armeniacum]|nr:hypothetical protein MKW92_029711 [Papaver armeniacum]